MGTALAVSDLEELESIIASGLRTFVDVGQALTRIRDGELYKATHRTFETYCSERWGFKRSYAYDLMKSAAVAENVRHGGQELPQPSTERQARELAKLPTEEQPKAWAEAVATAPPSGVTAKHVANVVAERLPKPQPAFSPDPMPASTPKTERQRITDEPQELDYEPESEPSPSLGELRPAYYDCDFRSVAVDRLDELAAQRNADQDYSALRNMQRVVAKSMPSRGQRMIDFTLDGGEIALLRLGLDWSVTEEKLKAAYRAASKFTHPDRGGSQADFVALNEAYKLVKIMLCVD